MISEIPVRQPTVVVAAAVVLRGPEVLVSKRAAGAHLAGLWEFPGGKVEIGEDPKDTVVRELHEELGVRVAVDDILDVTFHRYAGASGAPEKAVLLLFYAARLEDDSPPPRAIEVAAVAWKRADDLRDGDFPAADHAVLAKVKRLLATR